MCSNPHGTKSTVVYTDIGRIVNQGYRIDFDTIKISRWEKIQYVPTLNAVDSKRLKDGYIYIKQLWLQHHSLRIYDDH